VYPSNPTKHVIEKSNRGSCSAQAKETRRRSLLPRGKKDVTGAMPLCDYAQSRRIFWRWLSGATTLDLNENDLQAVPRLLPGSGSPWSLILALFALPAVETLVFWYSKDPICKQAIECVIFWLKHKSAQFAFRFFLDLTYQKKTPRRTPNGMHKIAANRQPLR
jgi:hypothetical protein